MATPQCPAALRLCHPPRHAAVIAGTFLPWRRAVASSMRAVVWQAPAPSMNRRNWSLHRNSWLALPEP
eukprot:7146318-Lingulodinium_polyedra.AAC.1